MTHAANRVQNLQRLQPPADDDMPLLHEDEDEGDMGEVSWHTDALQILHVCLQIHLAKRADLRVFANMNLYYRETPLHQRTGSKPYVSPDVMVVAPTRPLGADVRAFTIGQDGPVPLLTIEVLSRRSAQQRDKKEKSIVYARLGVQEYILVDTTGKFLKERLQMRRLGSGGSWVKGQDADGGVTSQTLGFRLVIDPDDKVRLIDAATGYRYPRPLEAALELLAQREAAPAKKKRPGDKGKN